MAPAASNALKICAIGLKAMNSLQYWYPTVLVPVLNFGRGRWSHKEHLHLICMPV